MASEAKHTPGPWHVESDEQVPERGTIYVHAAGWLDPNEMIAEAVRTDRDFDNGNVAEAEANARLIAAAPDMLEALKQAELTIVRCGPVDGAEALALADIRAAIAKAEGR